ncbi:MAG: alcohol dehydrogenase catalytic domain-containing protein [Actinomycetota bacterium]|nr:alcohol dehydrogenase catalytic domain-containing protein [Actinomycetota bacterium]
MKAVVVAGEGAVRVDEVADPTPTDDGDAIVRVTRSSICASDLHLLHGKTPGMRVGGVIGHEFTGVVDAARGLAGVREGDRVLGSFLIACGRCPACGRGDFNFCHNRRALGLGALTGDLDGAQAEYVRVPDAAINLKPLSAEAPADEDVLFAGDVLATGFYAAHLARTETSESVAVVVGGGPVGLSCALALGLEPDTRVLLLDTDPSRVDFAQRAGVETIDISEVDPQAAVAGATNGAMADVAIEAVGVTPAFKTAMKCVRDGGRVVVVGVYGTERYELPMGMVWIRGLQLRFSGMANVQAHWDRAVHAIADGSIDASFLITHRLPLEEAERGYELFESREAMKVVLIP